MLVIVLGASEVLVLGPQAVSVLEVLLELGLVLGLSGVRVSAAVSVEVGVDVGVRGSVGAELDWS